MQDRYRLTCTLWGNLGEGANVAPIPRVPDEAGLPKEARAWDLIATTVTKGDGNMWLFTWTWKRVRLT